MKNSYILLLLKWLILPLALYAQNNPAEIRNLNTQGAYYGKQSPTRASDYNYFKETKSLQAVKVSDDLYCLYDDQGDVVYVGEARMLKAKDAYFRSGRGICRYAMADPDGNKVYEYCLCNWKRDSRHGPGILVKEDGTYHKALWKWDKRRQLLQKELSAAEVEETNAMLEMFHTTLRVLHLE